MEIRNKNVIDAMYYSDLWIKLCRKSRSTVLREIDINKFNEESITKGYLTDIFKNMEEREWADVTEMISGVSKIPEGDRYKSGAKLRKEYYDKMQENMNLGELRQSIKVEYGIIVKRTKAKTFPTYDRVFKDAKTYELDRFIETAVYVGEPCAIYTTSRDGKWYFCETCNCRGWIHSDSIAIGEKSEIEGFCKNDNFIVVTARKLMLGFNPFVEVLSEENLDMGVKLPIEKGWERDNTVYDMYTEGSYVVKYPLRDRVGRLSFTNVLIPYSDDVHEGYLKCTRGNILRQAFKFQGERYGWGGEFEGRDCSSMIVDIFRCFGVNFPRNTGEQLRKSTGKTTLFDEKVEYNEKIRAVENLKPCTLIYLKGHVAMIIGKYKDKIYIIHDVIGVHVDDEGELVYLPIRGVTVSSLADIYTSGEKSYIDEIIGIKDMFS